jgi:small subunit ribosomal protein S16
MALKMRLKRLGRKGAPFYHIVVTDSRNARNGRFIERLGYYDPMKELSTIEMTLDRVVHWYALGARPSDSFASLLKAKKVNISALAAEHRAAQAASASV